MKKSFLISAVFRASLTSALFLCLAGIGVGQVIWLADASSAEIPAKPVSGQVKGKSFSANFGNVRRTGGMRLGDAEEFDHYTITLQDAESGVESSFSVELVLTVRKGSLPDARIFRRIRSSILADQPGPGRKDRGVLALAELYSFTIRFRSAPGRTMDWISSGADRDFTGRLELDKRRGDRLPARLYVCFDGPDKSACVAGVADLEIR